MSDPAIVFEDVTYGYVAGEPTLQAASFSIEKGEFIGIIGPNGGGKTTLLRLAMGFIKPWTGKITIFGQEANKHPNGIAYVPQTLRFDKQFPITVLELVLAGRLSHLQWWGGFSKKDRQKAFDALDRVKLLEFAEKPFGCLSGGQMQRALIARALVSDPLILFLDEPTASVDSDSETEIQEILTILRSQLTIIMVTHDIHAVVQKVDRLLYVQRKVAAMSSEQVCEHFALGLYHFPLVETKKGHLASFAKTLFH